MKEQVIDILKKSLKELGVNLSEEKINELLEVPHSSEMGDYAFPCFFLCKELKESPEEIALEIREKIGNPSLKFDDIQTSGAYINFFISRKDFAKTLIKEILSEKEKFGSSNIGRGKKAVIEHTSINPNASPHVGRARNALIGDSLVRIMRFLNFKTEVHYYVNDVSKQIAMLVFANADKLKFEGMLKKYVSISKKVEKSKKIEKKVFEILEKFEQGDKETVRKFRAITKTCVKGQERILSRLGIHYNFFDYESSYLKKSRNILKEFEKTKKLHKDKEGRLYLDQKGAGLEKQMKSPVLVLTRSDGTGLYPLRDIVYTLDKMKISKENYIVLGEDQKLYFQQIKQALALLKEDSPKVIHYSFILLKAHRTHRTHSANTRARKMSTRKGDVVLLEDFIKDAVEKAEREISKRKTKGNAEIIGIGAVKYSILKNNSNKIIIFNLEDALNFDGDTCPYIQYSYARASSILKKAKSSSIFTNAGGVNFLVGEMEPKEFSLVKQLSQFPDIVLKSYNSSNPSLIANYSYTLAKTFNEFYHECPVIGSEQKFFRLSLVDAFRHVLKNALSLLGIEVISEM